jgi:hypothetical protein
MNIPSYIYPPRAEVKVKPSELDKYDDDSYFAQPKYNGSCCVVFLTENEYVAWNRHKELITKFECNILPMHKGKGTMVISGEYLNKSQKGEYEQDLNKSFIIWDILGYEDEWLIGATTDERLTLIEKLYPCNRMIVDSTGKLITYNHLCCTEVDDVFKAPTYMHSFTTLYNDIVKTPLYEGLVLKKRNARLEMGFQEKNNTNWQIKCRKETKNYKF